MTLLLRDKRAQFCPTITLEPCTGSTCFSRAGKCVFYRLLANSLRPISLATHVEVLASKGHAAHLVRECAHGVDLTLDGRLAVLSPTDVAALGGAVGSRSVRGLLLAGRDLRVLAVAWGEELLLGVPSCGNARVVSSCGWSRGRVDIGGLGGSVLPATGVAARRGDRRLGRGRRCGERGGVKGGRVPLRLAFGALGWGGRKTERW